DLLGYYDAKQVITDIARGEVDLDTLKAGASLIPAGKVIKLPKVIKAIGNVGKTGFKKGKEGEKTVWKRFTQEDKSKPDKNKGNQSKTGSKSGTTTSKPNQEEASKSGQAKQTKARDKGESGARGIEKTTQKDNIPAPTEPYNRRKHYGNTPTKQDRKQIGGSPDHDPPLVKRYYEGDPSIGEKPGYLMTPEERKASAKDRSRMKPSTKEAQNKQGGEMSQYSKEMKKKYGLQ
ncbi:MAG: hypothetical protein IJX07_02580, partial [Bacillales bacterium]|nr:hypothetical protein [Bacillales bacterium]